jgi:hypothetical protein
VMPKTTFWLSLGFADAETAELARRVA